MMHSGTETDLKGKDKIALVGNPNVGKSVIFGLLTGQYVTVSNYPGTTVEVTNGIIRHDKTNAVLIDTPGINNLIPQSEDERVTRDILLEGVNYTVQVGDAKNLRRTLFITLQIAEMGLPYCLVLNMMDEAKSLGIEIDIQSLSKIISAPVIPTVAIERQGISSLFKIIQQRQALNESASRYAFVYDPLIEAAINRLISLFPDSNISRRFLALMFLSGDDSIIEHLCSAFSPEQIREMENIRDETARHFGQPLSYIINQARLKRIEEIVTEVEKHEIKQKLTFATSLGKLMMHPFWGIFMLLFVLWLIYEIVGVFGAGTMVNFLEKNVFGEYVNPAVIWLFEKIIPAALIRDFFTGNFGLITMAISYSFAIILPIVGTFFLVFSLLEDSGYLPRLAIMVNRLFHLVGLNGKAILPMVLGLGCGTMATMTTRILPTKKERLIATILLAVGVPCSAQLGVIMALLGGISWQAMLWWFAVVIIVMGIVGYLAGRVLKGTGSDFIMEIPPIRRPAVMNILTKTFARVKWYLKEVVPIFILGTAALWCLDKIGLLTVIEDFTSPVIKGMLGLPVEATRSFLIGFFRRDYGAAGLFDLHRQGLLTPHQIIVAAITITLFIPCFAQFLMMLKEHGWKTALAIVAFVFPLAILTGSLVNLILNILGV
ncbi:MAG: ferrous iron transport protein B [Planctomycetes bacterium]|nr:ferrous iron transport protein B [Planctomycetota bacterium]